MSLWRDTLTADDMDDDDIARMQDEARDILGEQSDDFDALVGRRPHHDYHGETDGETDDDTDIGPVLTTSCPACEAQQLLRDCALGALGSRLHCRCRYCGMMFSRDTREA